MSKILIVDDSTDILDAMQYFLEEKGYAVKCISKGDELLPAIYSFLPDLIILDIFLHGEDGRDICRKLRSSVATKYLCILLFSASGKDVRDYKEYGADGFLEKPFGLNQLIETVEATLRHCNDVYSPST
jgi:DNA-binding response OmpR family regulator